MSETNDAGNTQTFTIVLSQLEPGIMPNDMVSALQRLFPGKQPEVLRRALEALPLVLSRSATQEQANKVKKFLEPKGAILKITDSSSPALQTKQAETKKSTGGEIPGAQKSPQTPTTGATSYEFDRRKKPRDHADIKISPMNIGEILDRAFNLLRRHFWLFFFIILIPQGVFFMVGKAIQLYFSGEFAGNIFQNPDFEMMGAGFIISCAFAFILFMILQIWAQGALTHAISERYLGHSTTVGGSYRAMRSKLGRLLGTMVLMFFLLGLLLALPGFFAAILVPLLSKAGTNSVIIGILVALIVIFLIAVFIYTILKWLMVDKIVVLEDIGWMNALRRSKEIMKANPEGGFWKKTKVKALIIIILGVLIAVGIHIALQIPGGILLALMPGSVIIQTIQEVLNIAATSVVTVFTATAMILFYYDIRLRKEGFDLKMMAENI